MSKYLRQNVKNMALSEALSMPGMKLNETLGLKRGYFLSRFEFQRLGTITRVADSTKVIGGMYN